MGLIPGLGTNILQAKKSGQKKKKKKRAIKYFLNQFKEKIKYIIV